jgi:hypothetical protein
MHNRELLRSGKRKWREKTLRENSIKRSSRGSKIWKVSRRGLRRRQRLQRLDRERNKSLLSSAKSFKKKNILQSNKELSLRNADLYKKPN